MIFQVLTFQIAERVGLHDVEKAIDNYGHTENKITFTEYCQFLKVSRSTYSNFNHIKLGSSDGTDSVFPSCTTISLTYF